jgi:hypothetical protein
MSPVPSLTLTLYSLMPLQVTHKLQIVMVKRKDVMYANTSRTVSAMPPRTASTKRLLPRSFTSGRMRAVRSPAQAKDDVAQTPAPIANTDDQQRARGPSLMGSLPGLHRKSLLHRKSVLSAESGGDTSTPCFHARNKSVTFGSSPQEPSSADATGVEPRSTTTSSAAEIKGIMQHGAPTTQAPSKKSMWAKMSAPVRSGLMVPRDGQHRSRQADTSAWAFPGKLVEELNLFASTTAPFLNDRRASNARRRSVQRRSHPDSAGTELNEELAKELKKIFQQKAFAHKEGEHEKGKRRDERVKRLQQRLDHLGNLRVTTRMAVHRYSTRSSSYSCG